VGQREPYVEGGDTSTLMVDGTLYVAVFDDDQTGEWVPLTPSTTGMTEAEIAVFTRMAGSAVNATTMDRPEWIAVNPTAAEAYCCLTNNSRRGAINDDGTVRTNAGGEPMTVNGPNPREINNYGQIVRWRPAGGDHGATPSTGISTSWPATRPCMTTPMAGRPTSTRATCSTRPTG
jgi:secreted PhoX family phosphatase